MIFTPVPASCNLSRPIWKQKKTALTGRFFPFAISISLFRISTADKAFLIFLASVNFLYHPDQYSR
ncbi:hypothetical protein EUA40_17140 [Bacillus amyloliquefaciens]|nr:hypothetical protein EUA40_17140 [Bacillus amyloliquefaciens]TWP06159.1 hypothetical protein EUA38_03480 [Bacillus amyloliquefaciens]TXK69641.1 hypothetical protein FVD39_02915 [Bacillus amyloliquefaciens]